MISEIGQLMTVFTVHHTTTYRYRQPVRLGSHQLMFRPRDSFDQRLLDCLLNVTPEPVDIRWIHDAFGNCVTLVDFNSSCQILEFETTIRLDHSREMPPTFASKTMRDFIPLVTRKKRSRISPLISAVITPRTERSRHGLGNS